MFQEVLVDDGDAAPTPSVRKVASALERSGVYAHGNAKTLMAFFQESIAPSAPDRRLVRAVGSSMTRDLESLTRAAD